MTKVPSLELQSLQSYYASYIDLHESIKQKFYYSGFDEKINKTIGFNLAKHRTLMSYALLYVVIEGYNDLKINIPEINELLQKEDYVANLKKLRNDIFHYQKNPDSERKYQFLNISDSEIWIADVRKAFHNFLSEQFNMSEMVKILEDYYHNDSS